MKDFLQTSLVQIVIFITGLTGWMIGIYAAFIQRKSYNKQLDSEKGYEEILAKAKNDWEGKYNAEQVNLLKTELIKLENQVNTIKKDVPIKAREVFLTDQLYSLDEGMTESYKQRKKILKEIEALKVKSNEISLTTNIKSEIESIVKPLYLKKIRNEVRIKILLYSILGIVFVLVLPFLFQFGIFRIKSPFSNGDYGIPIYAFFTTALIFSLGIFLSINTRLVKEKHILKYKCWLFLPLILLLIFILVFGFLTLLILFDTINFNYIGDDLEKVIIGLIATFVFSISTGLFLTLTRKMIKLF